jgi:transcriptional regulator of arginine metabolism
LKIVKAPDPHGGYIYLLPKEQFDTRKSKTITGSNFLADGFISIDFSVNMAVIKTKPAYASSIAAAIDEAVTFEILGTIAGDDTIFLVLREGVEKGDLIEFLEKIMPNIKGKLI